MSAGHCYDGTEPPLSPSSPASVSGASVTIGGSCNVSTAPLCAPSYTYGGIDASVWTMNSGVSATGWFVHQAPAPPPFSQAVQGTAYTDLTINSLDLNNGDPMICIEGASTNKYDSAVSATSACGIAGGFTGAGFQILQMYPYNPVCRGDSGGYIRHPTGYGGSYNAGHFRAVSATEVPESLGCWMRTVGPFGTQSPALHAQINTFWKTHLWFQSISGRLLWTKTW